jgi:5-hydroxyisourate hydrolase
VSQVSTHVLDLVRGGPAARLRVALERRRGEGWERLAEAATDQGGRISGWRVSLSPGIYRLLFSTADYWAGAGTEGLYPEVAVAFRMGRDHLHLPLLLSPFGYTTYRGSR